MGGGEGGGLVHPPDPAALRLWLLIFIFFPPFGTVDILLSEEEREQNVRRVLHVDLCVCRLVVELSF